MTLPDALYSTSIHMSICQCDVETSKLTFLRLTGQELPRNDLVLKIFCTAITLKNTLLACALERLLLVQELLEQQLSLGRVRVHVDIVTARLRVLSKDLELCNVGRVTGITIKVVTSKVKLEADQRGSEH